VQHRTHLRCWPRFAQARPGRPYVSAVHRAHAGQNIPWPLPCPGANRTHPPDLEQHLKACSKQHRRWLRAGSGRSLGCLAKGAGPHATQAPRVLPKPKTYLHPHPQLRLQRTSANGRTSQVTEASSRLLLGAACAGARCCPATARALRLWASRTGSCWGCCPQVKTAGRQLLLRLRAQVRACVCA